MRINRYIAIATGMSRRAADKVIAEGRAELDGRLAVLGDEVATGGVVTFDGNVLALPAGSQLVMLNKPAGYVSSRLKQGSDPTLYSLIPKTYRRLRIAGRLDKDSSGLILLTDDGDFLYRHTHPSFGKIKVYDLTLSHDLTSADRDKLPAGVLLTDGPSKINVIHAHGPEVQVSLGEGRNRQIRRTFGALGYEVVRLHRLSIGPYSIGDLPEGGWREIEPS